MTAPDRDHPDGERRRRIVAVWNPASGGAPEEAELMSALPAGTELVETTADDPGTGQTERAVDDGADIVVACGGDGTVRACLAPLAGSATALGIVPLGTGNLLAANLGIRPGLDAAAQIGAGERRRLDLGWVNGEAFAVMAGSGFDALMIRDADDRLKSRLGTAAYVLSAVKHLRTEVLPTTVHVDGRRWFSGRTSMVLVGNFGRVSGGIEVFPDAEPDDGLLDVAVLSASTVREWASVGWRLVRGKQQRLDVARRNQGRHVVVEHQRPRAYELDGEDRDPVTRLEFEIEPAAITVQQGAE